MISTYTLTKSECFIKKGMIVLILLTGSLFSFGQDLEISKEEQFENWNFRIGPYFWFLGIKGTIEKPPTPTNYPEPEPSYDIDIPFKDVKNSLKFAFLLASEYRKDRFLATINFTSFILQGSAISPLDLAAQNIEYRLGFASGEAMAGYRILKKKKFKIDGLAGLKFIYFKIGGSTDIINRVPLEGERDKMWIDPIFALRFVYIPHYRVEFVTYADLGPFQSDNILSYQFIGAVNILISKWLYVSPGYRYWSVNTNKNEAIFNGQMLGFHIRLGAQF